jgi:hypothetical protein
MMPLLVVKKIKIYIINNKRIILNRQQDFKFEFFRISGIFIITEKEIEK